MKRNKALLVQLMGLASVFLVASCSQNTADSTSFGVASPKTGWAYNKKENGGYEVRKKQNNTGGPGLLPLEGGTFVMGGSADVDLAYEHHSQKRRVTVASFFMDETEVSNLDWLEYMHWVRHNFPLDREYYHNVLPDTLVWRRNMSYNEPYVDNYLRHPAYGDYPVVGITWEQATEYCVWRTDRVNEHILRSKGYMKDWKTILAEMSPRPVKGRGGKVVKSNSTASSSQDTVLPFNTDVYLGGQYKGPKVDGDKMPTSLGAKPIIVKGAKKGETKSVIPRRPIGIEDGILKQPYRLPTEAEWEYAALALVGNTDYENITDGRVFPWSGLGVRSAKDQTRGLILANFKRRGGDLMGAGGYLNDKEAITAPVRSYIPNDFGLYNMAGNVSEWTADVYRQLTSQEVEDLNPYRGNEFSKRKTSDDGKIRKMVLDKHGIPIREASVSDKKLSWAEMQKQSADSASLEGEGNAEGEVPQETADAAKKSAPAGKPFKADVRDFGDSSTNSLYGIINLINNRSRVYKGGSWNDRVFWLNPATRRHMQQDESSAEIGFRCAMTMVGKSEIYTADKPHHAIASSSAGEKLTPTRRKKGVVALGGRK